MSIHPVGKKIYFSYGVKINPVTGELSEPSYPAVVTGVAHTFPDPVPEIPCRLLMDDLPLNSIFYSIRILWQECGLPENGDRPPTDVIHEKQIVGDIDF